MNNTTQLLAVLAEYPHLSASVYKAIQALAFIEREWGMCPPITSIHVVDDKTDHWLEVIWSWVGAVSVTWRFIQCRNATFKDEIHHWTSIGNNRDSKWNPTPKDVAIFLSRYINHIAEHAWDYRNW